MIALESTPLGTILPVRAHAAARRSGIVGEQAGMLKVCVTQAPERGKANKAIVEVLCDELQLRKSQVELLSGETSSHKRFLVRDLSSDQLANRIAAAFECT